MEFKEALKEILIDEYNASIVNNTLLTYSILKDKIAGDFYQTDLANYYYQINQKINVYQVLVQYGITEGLNYLRDAYRDLFDYLDSRTYKDMVRGVVWIIDANYVFVKKKNHLEPKVIQKDDIRSLSEGFPVLIDTNGQNTINLNFKKADIWFTESPTSQIKIISNSKRIIDLKVGNKKNMISIDVVSKIAEDTDIKIMVPKSMNYLIAKTSTGNIALNHNVERINFKTTKGNICVTSDCKNALLITKTGLIGFYGKADYISGCGIKSNITIKHSFLTYKKTWTHHVIDSFVFERR